MDEKQRYNYKQSLKNFITVTFFTVCTTKKNTKSAMPKKFNNVASVFFYKEMLINVTTGYVYATTEFVGYFHFKKKCFTFKKKCFGLRSCPVLDEEM